MRSRKSQVKTIPSNKENAIKNIICASSTLCTYQIRMYMTLPQYIHKSVNHRSRQFVNDITHTNSTETVWTVPQKNLNDSYHCFSNRHLQLYVNSFVFKLNKGNVMTHTLDKVNTLLSMCIGKSLTYRELMKESEPARHHHTPRTFAHDKRKQ